MGNTLPAARSTPSAIADQPGRIRGWSMDSAHSAHSDSSAFSFLSQDSASSAGSGTLGRRRGGGVPSDTVPEVSARFETMCVTLMDVPWNATEALDDWRLLFGSEYLPSVCLAAAYVLALYGAVNNPTAWETLRQHGLPQHAHAACSVGGGLLHRVCCLRRRDAADVAALLLESGACPAQVAYCPPVGAMAVDERPIDSGAAGHRAGGVRSANLETLQCTQGGYMLSPVSAAAQWGHPDTLHTLLHPPSKAACQPVDRTASDHGIVVRATRSTLLIPLSRGVTAILTPLTGQMQFAEAATLAAAAPALKAPPAALERDTLVHACVAALVAVRPRAVRRLLRALDCAPGMHAASIVTAPGCNELVECSRCPLQRKVGGGERGGSQRQPGVYTALPPARLPRAPAPLGTLAAALLLSLPRGCAAERGALACCLELAAAGQAAGAGTLTHLRAAKAACYEPLVQAQAWGRRRGLVVHRRQARRAMRSGDAGR